MGINSAYKLVKQSIVAFTLKYVPIYDEKGTPPPFPPILGTGFVVHPDGILATNAHVVNAFSRVFRPADAPRDEWPVQAKLLKLTEEGMVEIPLQILGVAKIGQFKTGPVYYGPKEGPDLAFVKVKARGLPAVSIDSKTVIEEGYEIATAGFPMGTDALTAPGWLHQLTPTLQRGIVSAVLPFVCATPHAYSINVMTQGGASGSPVFSSDSGAVVGVLYGGLRDFHVTKEKDLVAVPTNISYVVPSHYIEHALGVVMKNPDMKPDPEALPIDEMLRTYTRTNLFEKGRDWVVKKVDPKIEESRVESLSRVLPSGKNGG